MAAVGGRGGFQALEPGGSVLANVTWKVVAESTDSRIYANTPAAVKWTPSVGPKAGWRKRDACSDFVIIKNTS